MTFPSFELESLWYKFSFIKFRLQTRFFTYLSWKIISVLFCVQYLSILYNKMYCIPTPIAQQGIINWCPFLEHTQSSLNLNIYLSVRDRLVNYKDLGVVFLSLNPLWHWSSSNLSNVSTVFFFKYFISNIHFLFK